MTDMDKVIDIVADFNFKKGDFLGAEEQLSMFSDYYAELSIEEADFLRSMFDGKDRLGWFRVASTLLQTSFPEAESLQRDKLCKIFFALYSFDNLGFGYDSVMDVIEVSKMLKNHQELARKNWDPFKKLTSNPTARNNLENKIFVS